MAERTLVLKSRTEMFPLTPEISFVLDGVAQRNVATEAADIAYERCAPVRTFVSWPGKRNYSGSYWSSTTRTHIGFESLFECTALTTLDRDPDIVGISSQPMWIRWPRGHTPKSHAPDYFARHQNGDGEIIDVRPEKLIDEATAVVFEATRQLCRETGFRYRVISDLSAELDRNFRFLSSYRDPVWATPINALENLSSPGRGITVVELARYLSPENAALGLGQVYWLIWHQKVSADLDKIISLRSSLTLPARTA